MSKFFNIKVDASGLSIFRIFYSLVLFGEILQLYKFRHIIYDKDPFVYVGELDVSFLFYFWFPVLLLMFLGLFTRFATILNYIFSVIIFSSASKFEYHVFYVYVGVNFLLMFVPIARVFSLDNLLQKIKFSTIYKKYEVNNKILQVNYFIIVFIGIGLVYIDSVFHKLSSKLWVDGLGVWLPSSLPMITWNDTSFLLNQKWLVLFLGYLVLIFEATFVFLFWFKKCRVPLLLLGIFFHIGILIAYPIPYFALTYIAIYLLLVPSSFWLQIANKLKFKKTVYTFYYDAECPLCNKVIIIINHFDVFGAIKCQTVQGTYSYDPALKDFEEEALLINIHGVNAKGKVAIGYWSYIELLKALVYTYPLGLLGSLSGISFLGRKIYAYVAGNRLTERCTSENCSIPIYNAPVPENQDFLVKGWNQLKITQFFWKGVFIVVIFGQLLMIWFSPTIQNNIPAKDKLNKIVNIPYKHSEWFLKRFLGITPHTVFLNQHFNGFNHIFKVMYVGDQKEKIVPILNNNGMPDEYNAGALWRNISFNVITAHIEKDKIQKGIIPYLKFYIKDNKLSNPEFEFYVKEIEIPEKWEKDYLKKQIAKPWTKVGSCKIIKDSAAFYWNENMQAILNSEANAK
jgi:predicted DCC family thiol-disulfide oxidoreductase YuxK